MGRPLREPPLWTRLARDLSGSWAFLVYSLAHLGALRAAPAREVFDRQLYFTGVQGLGPVLALGLLAGTLVVTQTVALVGANSDLTVQILDWTVVEELGPLLAAVIIVARASVAIATELALMQTRREIDHLETLRIPPLDYLVVPRVAALTLSVMALTIYFQVVAVVGGLAAGSLFQHASFGAMLSAVLLLVSPGDLAVSLAKALLFGLAIAAVSCWQGLAAGGSTVAVPRAAMRAVMHSLVAVFLVDAGFAYAWYVMLG